MAKNRLEISVVALLLAARIAAADDVPVLQSVTLSSYHISDGGAVTVTVTAVSISPVDLINRSLDGPNGNIYDGGGTWPPWSQINSNTWQCQWSDEISPWAPSGEYVYSGISCENEAQLESATWSNLVFTVDNPIQATSPVLQSVTLSTAHIQNGGSVTVTVTAVSSAPVDLINRSLDGPNGNIYDGGGTWPPWSQINSNTWQCQWTDDISSWAPSGEYVYSGISCESEAQLESATWSNLIFRADGRRISAMFAPANSNVTIRFPTESGRAFVLQSIKDLSSTNWQNVETVQGTGQETSITHSVSGTAEFYRVIMSE
jgi:hypothetical protein